jgi:deoxyribodipyrimidine photolyase-related protein
MHLKPDVTTEAVLGLVAERFPDNFGDLEPFWFAVTPGDAKRAFKRFVEQALPRFGDYQDAMLADEDWLFHAAISQYLNIGLLDPLDCCREAEAAYRAGRAPLNAVEGFIRQILGWREYVRGIYWLKMPEYAETNALAAERPLPAFYWTGETEMNCLAKVIDQTRREAQSHHIQRLMITGNFALLAGLQPEDVNLWYLVVYADAYEWVELPNVQGMALFADDGLLGTKPYAAGGNYINKMSDFCDTCRFNVRKKSGADACPFNYLYWNFLIENEEELRGNPRLAPVFRTLGRMSDERVKEIRDDAARFLESLQPWERAA